MLNREYWPVERYSVRWPATVLLKGMAPKLVAATLPVLVVRKTFSKSTKPPGVNSAAPMRKESGDAFGCSCGGGGGSATRRAAAEELTALGRDVASTMRCDQSPTLAATSCLLTNFFSIFLICSCCCDICFFCSAIASRSFLSSSAILSEAETVFEVFWPNIKLEAKIVKQRLFRNFIYPLSPLASIPRNNF